MVRIPLTLKSASPDTTAVTVINTAIEIGVLDQIIPAPLPLAVMSLSRAVMPQTPSAVRHQAPIPAPLPIVTHRIPYLYPCNNADISQANLSNIENLTPDNNATMTVRWRVYNNLSAAATTNTVTLTE